MTYKCESGCSNCCSNVSVDLWRVFPDWMRLYQGIWVWDLDLFIWFPAELLCCLTGTCTNSLNHGRIIDRVADFPLAPLQPASQTPLMNANWTFFYLYSCLSHPPRFLYAPLKLTPLLCVSDCMSVLVSESVKLTLLRGVLLYGAKLDTELAAVCKWPFIRLFPVVLGAHSNALCTLLNCWINSTE